MGNNKHLDTEKRKLKGEFYLTNGSFQVGVIGLGNMGSAIGESILKGGFKTYVYDINRDATLRLEALGACVAESPKRLVEDTNVILTSLPSNDIVRNLFLGEDGLVSAAKPGTIFIELSTIDADTIKKLDRVLGEKSAILLDVPVSGSPDEARQGKLKLIASGDINTVNRVDCIFKCFGEIVKHVGPAGNAKVVKIVNNLMTMGNVLVAAEAFSLGVKAGIDPDILFEVINQSGGRSHHFGKRFPNLLARNFNPGFTVDMGEKDVRLGLDLSKSVNVPVPVASLVSQIYKIAMSEGINREDIVAIAKLYEKWGNLEIKGSAAMSTSNI